MLAAAVGRLRKNRCNCSQKVELPRPELRLRPSHSVELLGPYSDYDNQDMETYLGRSLLVRLT